MTERRTHPLVRLVFLLTSVLICFGAGLSTAPPAMAEDKPEYHLDYGPDSGKECPTDFTDQCGVDKQGNYCDYWGIDDPDVCRMPEAGEAPGTVELCEGQYDPDDGPCTAEGLKEVDRKKLEEARKANLKAVREGNLKQADYDKWNKFMTECVEKGTRFDVCKEEAYRKFGPLGGKTLADWVGDKISELARDALEEAAQYVGNAVVWLLEEFAEIFNKASVIDLDDTGIEEPTSIAMALSAVIAAFLLLLQFGKVAISHQGGPAATAIAGLAKWAIILCAYWTVTTTALTWSDAVSDWIVQYTFHPAGDTTPSEAMKQKFGEMFGGLIVGGGGAATVGGALITGEGVGAAAVAVVIVIGIVCILAIGALWIEVLLRQAGIMILMATMPIVLAGQLSEATKDWWPKARDALLALILMKPMIVFCFSIGFFAIEQGEGVQNMIVGLLIFLMACFCWPVLAKFMTFSSLGAGAAMAGGMISSLGSSASSMSGGRVEGAGSVGGGPAYTRALERDNAQTAAGGSNAQGGGGFWTNESLKSRIKGPGGRLGTRVAGPLGLGLQVVALGKDTLESGMANTAAHAGLDHASPGGRHVVIPPRGRDTASLPPEQRGEEPRSRPDSAPVITGPPNTDIPAPRREG